MSHIVASVQEINRGKWCDISQEKFFVMFIILSRQGGFVNGSVISTKYRPSSIPSGGLEIPLLLKFLCPEQKTFEKMKKFVDFLYDYDYSGVND